MSWDAVVVNYNGGAHLMACVGALRDTARVGNAPNIVVVDNGSTDGSDADCERTLGVSVLRPGRNLGYGRAANLGIAATRAPVVAVCNPDTMLDAAGVEVVAERFALEQELGALGPRIENVDGTVYPSARTIPAFGDAVGHAVLGLVWPENPSTRRYRQLDADPAVPRDVDWVSGAAIWLRRAALDDVGGWDERYFMYVEDVDLCERLRGRGWRVGYEPRVRVVHVQGVSTDRHPYRMIAQHHRSLARYAADHWHGPRRLLLVPAVVLLAARAGAAMAAHAARGRMPRSETAGVAR